MCRHISILLPNRPGEFFAASKVLRDQGVNVLGYQLSSQGSFGILHVLCSNHDKAHKLLFQKYQYYCNEKHVLICKVEHSPGSLMEILTVLENKNLNLENSYQALDSSGNIMVVIELIDRSQTSLSEDALGEAGVDVISKQPV